MLYPELFKQLEAVRWSHAEELKKRVPAIQWNRYLANGGDPSLVGRSLHEAPGVPLAIADGFQVAARQALAGLRESGRG